jgi:hypothetical protein
LAEPEAFTGTTHSLATMERMTTQTSTAAPRSARARLALALRRIDDYTREAFNPPAGHRGRR